MTKLRSSKPQLRRLLKSKLRPKSRLNHKPQEMKVQETNKLSPKEETFRQSPMNKNHKEVEEVAEEATVEIEVKDAVEKDVDNIEKELKEKIEEKVNIDLVEKEEVAIGAVVTELKVKEEATEVAEVEIEVPEKVVIKKVVNNHIEDAEAEVATEDLEMELIKTKTLLMKPPFIKPLREKVTTLAKKKDIKQTQDQSILMKEEVVPEEVESSIRMDTEEATGVTLMKKQELRPI